MSPLRLPLEAIVPEPADVAVLEDRARQLAQGQAAPAVEDRRLVVRFQLGGQPWAVESRELQHALAQIGPVIRVPGDGGRGRLVAFFHERPLPVFDLDELVEQGRSPERLARAPALVLRDEEGPIACAVEGPLDLAELAVTHTAAAFALRALALPLAGRLSDGAMLFDVEGLRQRASRAVRS
jgi:chemotaxis protein histidine kinase CheA